MVLVLNRTSLAVVWPLAAALVAGCSGTPPLSNTGPIAVQVPPGAESYEVGGRVGTQDATLRPGDMISIAVAGEDGLNLPQVKIGQDGAVMVPVAGRIQAAGRTVEQVAIDIRQRLASTYLRDPQVAVNILTSPSRFVTVEGAVSDPGVFAYEPNTTLLGAVALANGPSRVAQLDQVVVFRTINGQPNAARFDLNMIRSGRMIDPVLLPQDRIVIGVSGRAQALQDVLQLTPAFAILRPF